MDGSNDRLAGLYDRQTLIFSRLQDLEAGSCYQTSDRTNLSEEQASLEDKLRQVRDHEGPSAIIFNFQGHAHAAKDLQPFP